MCLKVSMWRRFDQILQEKEVDTMLYQINANLEKIGKQVYRLKSIPPKLEEIHNMFHVCFLPKWLEDNVGVVSLNEIQLNKDKRLIKEPQGMMDRKTKKLKRKMTDLPLAKWNIFCIT